MERYLFLCSVVLVLGVTMVVPTLRVWRRTGAWPVVFNREADPFQRSMSAATSSLFIALLAWAAVEAMSARYEEQAAANG